MRQMMKPQKWLHFFKYLEKGRLILMSDQIKIDCESVKATAAKFASESNNINAMVQRINGYKGTLNQSWKGTTQEKFMQDLETDTITKISKYADHFEKINKALVEIADSFQDTDTQLSSKMQID